MPRLLDYSQQQTALLARGIKPLYHNSGTFGFIDHKEETYVGWIGDDDPTLRPEMRELAIEIPAPHPQKLSQLVLKLWREIPGPIWFTPGSHWAYEIQDGGEHYMPQLLRSIDIDPGSIENLNQGSAIEFDSAEFDLFGTFLKSVLEQTHTTDYGLLFPGAPIIGLIHHHRQIWWRTTDTIWRDRLRALPLFL